MPSVSKAQQRLFGFALAYKRGEIKDAPKKIKDIANKMSLKDLEDLASTKHDKLPNTVDGQLVMKFSEFKNKK